METKHLQSMIAINANRITEKHARISAVLTETRQFKAALPAVSPLFLAHVQGMLKKAYSIVDKSRVELKKAVEMQKALQAELRTNRAAEKAEKAVLKAAVKSRFFVQANGSTWADGTVCIEVTGKGSYICYMKDGSTRVIVQTQFWGDANWAAKAHGVKEVNGVPNVQAPGIYTIDTDGHPKKDGVYDVYYSFSREPQERLYENGEWKYTDGNNTAFGNFHTQGERYIVK